MNNRRFTYEFEEDLIRQSAVCPLPSAGLRTRIIAAAERAARRRLRIRRAVGALFVCAWLVGSILWGRSVESNFGTPTRGNGVVVETEDSEVFSAQRQVAVCSLGEWAHVEWFVRLREAQCQILRGAY